MGRRSINTTKSGKYMNPTDQARKEARKKELKKNKKQRQMVRAAVLKGKDPAQLLDEMEKIDEMEYNVMQPSPLNEKVLKEKRKKLKETFDRVMRLYHNDDPELWSELKRKEAEYERRRNKKVQYYESVRHAQTVQIDDIPLPQMTDQPPQPLPQTFFPPGTAPPALPGRGPPNLLPNFSVPPLFNSSVAPPPIESVKLSEQSKSEPKEEKKSNDPPGCPPGPPPLLIDMRELDSDYESDHDSEDSEPPIKQSRLSRRRSRSSSSSSQSESSDENEVKVPKPTSLQQRILAIAGQEYDDFMKELENVHKKKDQDRTQDKKDKEKDNRRSSDEDPDSHSSSSSENEKEKDSDEKEEDKPSASNVSLPAAPPVPNIPALDPKPPVPPFNAMQPPQMMKLPNPPPPPMGMPPAMMFRPPPMRPGLQSLRIRMPPGMAGAPPRMRMPPGPPPGMPPGRMMHHGQHNKNAPPSMLPHPNAPGLGPQQAKDTKGMTTITAKPQIRNLSADVTRFVPASLRVKRDEKKVQKPKSYISEYSRHQADQSVKAKGTTKDDAYMQFMREMDNLL